MTVIPESPYRESCILLYLFRWAISAKKKLDAG